MKYMQSTLCMQQLMGDVAVSGTEEEIENPSSKLSRVHYIYLRENTVGVIVYPSAPS